MVSLNRVILAGRLTRDPQTKALGENRQVVLFSIAVTDRYRAGDEAKEDVSFFDVACYGTLGETCAQRLTKGSAVVVEGKLRQRRWEADGVKRSAVQVLADNVQFVDVRPRAAA